MLLALLLAESYAGREREAARHAAEQAAQRAAFDRSLVQDREGFLRLVAHELKTPVAVVKAYAELLEAQALREQLPPTIRQVVGHIREQADHMVSLIEEVLDAQRLQLGKLPLELSRFDLGQLAREVAEEIGQTSRAHEVRVEQPAEPLVLLADRRRLRQVLVNLLENAVKFSAGGEVLVRLTTEERAGRPWAVLSVRDQGVGIEAADLQRIFDRFAQASEAPVRGHVGLGLGLYIARELARAHGGEIWAVSAGRGQGSTFYLALPLDREPEP